MIDNINIIKSLLNFENQGDFYYLLILRRKKDQPEGEKDNHQSVRTIKTYCIDSIEYLDKRYDEIIQLCELFRARAYIHIQKQNHKDVSLELMVELATRIKSNYFNQKHIFDSVVGQLKVYEKRWIVDIDTKSIDYTNGVINVINELQPVGDKIECVIPTKNGFHLITKPFRTDSFKSVYPDIDVQKKNPTLCYYPNSLETIK